MPRVVFIQMQTCRHTPDKENHYARTTNLPWIWSRLNSIWKEEVMWSGKVWAAGKEKNRTSAVPTGAKSRPGPGYGDEGWDMQGKLRDRVRVTEPQLKTHQWFDLPRSPTVQKEMKLSENEPFATQLKSNPSDGDNHYLLHYLFGLGYVYLAWSLL